MNDLLKMPGAGSAGLRAEGHPAIPSPPAGPQPDPQPPPVGPEPADPPIDDPLPPFMPPIHEPPSAPRPMARAGRDPRRSQAVQAWWPVEGKGPARRPGVPHPG
jgi:hypothetical protein